MSAIPTDSRHLNVLIDVARQMGETFELKPLLETIERASRAALGCDRATIFLYHSPTDELYSTIATGTGEIRFSARLGIAGQAAQTRGTVHVPDAYADPRFNQEIDRRTGYRTRNILSLPLVEPSGQLVGVLQVLNKLEGAFTDADILLAGALASLTAITLKRQFLLDAAAEKERMERDLNIARQIQQELLPKTAPRLDGWDVAGWNQPADQTGGDLFDFLPFGDRAVGFVIADATGHGIGPALIVAECRALLRGIMGTLPQREDDALTLASIATAVNRLICDDLPSGRFVTAAFGCIEVARGEVQYVSAGHGPILLCRGGEQAEELEATGMPLGILEDAEMEGGPPVRMEPGDVLLLLTDGFTEWANPEGELYGTDRVSACVRRHQGASAAELIQLLYNDVLAFSRGVAQADDLTAIVIKRCV